MISKENIKKTKSIYYSPSSIRQALTKSIFLLKENIDCYSTQPGINFTRNRMLPVEKVIYTILNLSSKSTKSELSELFLDEVPTDSAFHQQRAKLQASAFKRIFHLFNRQFDNHKTYKGYYLLACDGSDINIPLNPNDKETFRQNKDDMKGYNQLHLNALYDVLNHIYQDVYIDTASKTRECGAFKDMLKAHDYPSNSIMIADRGYEKYDLIANCIENKQKFVFRVKDITSNGILANLNLPDEEFDLEVKRIITRKQTKEVKCNKQEYVFLSNKTEEFDYLDFEHEYYEMTFRVIRFKITEDTYECLVTNVSKDEISALEMKEIYHLRWDEETSFRNLKWTIGIIYFHSKKQEYIRQEIYASLIMYNLSQLIINNTMIEDRETKYEYKANFKTAVTQVRLFMKGLIDEFHLQQRIKKFLIPIRPGRTFARNVRPQSTKSQSYFVA